MPVKPKKEKNHILKARRLKSRARSLARSKNKWKQKAKMLEVVRTRYETIFENTGTATLLIESNYVISATNSWFSALLGLPKNEIENKKQWTEFIHPDDLARMKSYHINRRKDRDSAPKSYEFRLMTKHLGVRDIAITIDMIPGTGQSVASLMDFTDTRRLEREILAVAQKERGKIGRDLHDDLGSHLSGVELLGKALQKKIADTPGEASALLETIRTLIKDAIEKTRRLSQGLYPVHIIEHGLEASFGELAVEVENLYQVNCPLMLDNQIQWLDNDMATHIYFIVREAVFNAARHGSPDRITIATKTDSRRLTVTVSDNGTGFDTTKAAKGMGLHTMTWRAKSIGMSFSVCSDKNRGTKVMLSGDVRVHQAIDPDLSYQSLDKTASG